MPGKRTAPCTSGRERSTSSSSSDSPAFFFLVNELEVDEVTLRMVDAYCAAALELAGGGGGVGLLVVRHPSCGRG